MGNHGMLDRMRVARLLPFCEINLPIAERVYSRSLADFLLDTEAETGVLAAAEREEAAREKALMEKVSD